MIKGKCTVPVKDCCDIPLKVMERIPWLLERDARFAVKLIFDVIAQGLVDGRRTEVRGFGAFWPRKLEPYMHHCRLSGGYNPTLGKRHVRFRAAAWLRKALADPKNATEKKDEDIDSET
jgi:integration host factor subunit beta